MKNFVFFLSVLFVFSACQNTEQIKADVEGLSVKWEATSTNVNNFTTQLSSEVSNFNNMLASMNMEQTVFESLPTESQAKIEEAKQSCTELGGDYTELQNEIKTFLSEWESKNAELIALQESAATGEFTGDVAAQITALNDFVADADAKLVTWNSNFETVKTACATSHNNYSSVLAEVIPAEKK